jgi:hypothetical protein
MLMLQYNSIDEILPLFELIELHGSTTLLLALAQIFNIASSEKNQQMRRAKELSVILNDNISVTGRHR